MALYSNEQLAPLVRTHGRTWFDAQTGGIWSVSYTHLTLPTICSV